jgi:hypothetical protein
MLIEFNVNNYVYVQLTDVGREALRERHNKLFTSSKIEYIPPEEDSDGWSRWHMWELMQVLG